MSSPQNGGHLNFIPRSSSFLGTIKNIVTAPLTWLSSTDDFEHNVDAGGKRKHVIQSTAPSPTDEETSQRIKRMRIHSPDRDQPSVGYLDPPQAAFNNVSKPFPSTARASSNQPPSNRHTLSPSRRMAFPTSRTMSLDPPPFRQRSGVTSDASMRSIPSLSMQSLQDIPMEPSPVSASRDRSSGSSFRLRSSLTPQPSGSGYGPVIKRSTERDGSEPPPLAALRSKPVFVRAPSEQQLSSNVRPSTTLGSLADAQRNTLHQPSRSFNFGSHSGYMYNVGFSNLGPSNAAEKALLELDIYKTPLLPTRLRGSVNIPDMFKQRKSHSLILMHESDDKPQLGKGKGKEVNAKKPYAGEGGMKRLMARRKREEAQEKARAQAQSMDDTESPAKFISQKELTEEVERPDQISTKLDTPLPWSSSGREQSSLRVGRNKSSRTHAPSVNRYSKRGFSASYDDDMDNGDEDGATARENKLLEEASKKPPMFDVPAGFTFAKDKEVPQVLSDSSNANEPPLQSLPFSFTKPAASAINMNRATGTVARSAKSFSFEPMATNAAVSSSLGTSKTGPAPLPESSFGPIVARNADSAASEKLLSSGFDFSKPTSNAAPSTPSTTSAVPNFFAGSPALSKPLNVAMPSRSFTPHPSSRPETPDPAHNAPGGLGKPTESVGLGFPSKPADNVAGSGGLLPPLFGDRSSAPIDSKTVNQETTSTPSAGFRSPSATPSTGGFSFGSAPSAPSEPKSQAGMAFGGDKAAEPPKSLFGNPTSSVPSSQTTSAAPFSFGQPLNTPVAEPSKATPGPSLFGQPSSAATAESSKPAPSPFPFGQSSNAVTAESLKPPPSGFAFGQSSNVVTAESSKSAPGPFSFGQSSNSTSASTTETVKAPASSAFSFDQPSSSTKSAAVTSNPFSFGAAPATPPAAEKKGSTAFSFGTTPTSSTSTSFSFGNPAATTTTESTNKPFAFGSAPPPRPATPPNQEFRMEESPTRDMQTNNVQKLEDRPTLGTGFSFGAANNNPSGGLLFGKPNETSTASSGSTAFPFGSSTGGGFGSATHVNKTGNQSTQGFSFSGGGFGQQSTDTGFSFGQKADAPRPSTAESFTTTPTSAAPFSFNSNANVSNPFSQQTGSTPSSPAIFNQPNQPFSFGSGTNNNASSAPFAFSGSQPASPATGDVTLPSSGGGFSFGAPAASSPGGTLFTIGAAPAQARPLKRLPNRRPTTKR